ncbi:hypothetical protein [Butyrivibrio sp. VCD2006]|uniref:hypothetical protein n=1 Tax=Butyrivibrio sp. VCD2006 TaxID=1280664 RepID=UPI0003F62179|nr:hypothetical protein [Butyrivibrio sp. VCD2006]
MALFGRNYEDELDNNYMPLEEFAPTISRQEAVKRKKLTDLISPIRDIPIALKGRRNQIENDLDSFSCDQDESFDALIKEVGDIVSTTEGHIDDVGTLNETIEKVRDALSSIKETTDSLPSLPDNSELAEDIEIPQINLPKLAEEYMPDPDLVTQIRSYSSFSHILKKSVAYTLSSLEQYHAQVQSLSKKKEMLESLASEADLLALNTTIDATHMNEESREFSTTVAAEVGNLSRKIHEISAALDAELDALENGFKTVRSSVNTIESAHRDAARYADMYSSASNEYYRQSTNYTNILIQSLSRLNQDFRETLDKQDALQEDYLEALDVFRSEIMSSAREIVYKGSRIGSVLDGCIRGSASLKDEMTETLENIKELKVSLAAVRKTDAIRKSKYSAALLKAFDQDIVWLHNKIESVIDASEEE